MPVDSSPNPDDPVLRASGLGLQHSGDRHGVMRRRGPDLRALVDVDLEINSGAIVWLVGELRSVISAAGVLAGVVAPTTGQLTLSGTDITNPGRKQRALVQAQVACLLPEELSVLAEKRTAGQVVADTSRHAPKAQGLPLATEDLLVSVGLPVDRHDLAIRDLTAVERWQVRVACLAAQLPRLVVLAANDPQVPREVRNALDDVIDDLRMEHGTAQVVVAPRLPTALVPPARAVVLCGGRVVEVLGTGDLDHPLHPYSRTLLPVEGVAGGEAGVAGGGAGAGEGAAGVSVAAAGADAPASMDVETMDAESRPAKSVHSPVGLSEVGDEGCPYRGSCPRVQARCAEMPELTRPLGASHVVACHFPEDPRRGGLRTRRAATSASSKDLSRADTGHDGTGDGSGQGGSGQGGSGQGGAGQGDAAQGDSGHRDSGHGDSGYGEPTAHEFVEG